MMKTMGKALNKVPDALHMSSDVDERACCAVATCQSCLCCCTICTTIYAVWAKKEAAKAQVVFNDAQHGYIPGQKNGDPIPPPVPYVHDKKGQNTSNFYAFSRAPEAPDWVDPHHQKGHVEHAPK